MKLRSFFSIPTKKEIDPFLLLPYLMLFTGGSASSSYRESFGILKEA